MTSLLPNVRFNLHLSELKRGIHFNKDLQNDFILHGETNFEFTVVEVNLTKEEALKCERSNCEQTADFCYNWTYVKSTLSNNPNWKKEWTQEQKDAVSKRVTGSKHTVATKEKMRKTAKTRSRWLSLIDSIEDKKTPIKDNHGNIFDSLTSAADFHKITPMTLCDIIKGRHNYTREGVGFKLADDETPWKPNPRLIYCSNGKIYVSAKDAERDTGETRNTIYKCINSKDCSSTKTGVTFWKQ